MCDCIDKIYKTDLVSKYHTRLCVTIPLEPGVVSKVIIRTEKTYDAPRGTRPFSIIASHCPFCGEKYQDAVKTEGE
jgi:hypothetical protein